MNAELDELLAEGRRLLSVLLRDCRNSELAGLFTSGFADCDPVVADPCKEVDEWTDRATTVMKRQRPFVLEPLDRVPARDRKALESDASYAARCLRARLTAVEATLPHADRAPPATGLWRRGWLRRFVRTK